MKIKKIFQLPIPQSGCGNVRFCFSGLDGLLEFEFRKNGSDYIGGIQFNRIAAFRFRDEMRSDGYADESYESVIEVLDSDWKKELKKIEPPSVSSISERHHFAALLSSNGYFEVIAKECSLVEEKMGLL